MADLEICVCFVDGIVWYLSLNRRKMSMYMYATTHSWSRVRMAWSSLMLTWWCVVLVRNRVAWPYTCATKFAAGSSAAWMRSKIWVQMKESRFEDGQRWHDEWFCSKVMRLLHSVPWKKATADDSKVHNPARESITSDIQSMVTKQWRNILLLDNTFGFKHPKFCKFGVFLWKHRHLEVGMNYMIFKVLNCTMLMCSY